MVNMEWTKSNLVGVSTTSRSSIIFVSAIVLLAACGSSPQTLGVGASTPPSENIVRAMAVVGGRGDAAELCMRAAGLDGTLVRLPEVSIDTPTPPVAGFGIGDLVGANGGRSSSQTQAENNARYGKLDAAQRAVWDRCVSDWTGQERESKDLSAVEKLTTFGLKQMRAAITASADSFRAWSACVATSTGVTVDYPWTLRKQLADESTIILEQNGAVTDRAAQEARTASFKERARRLAEADSACYDTTAKRTFEAKSRSLLDQAPPEVLAAAQQLLASRPPYSGWMDRENAFVRQTLP